MVRIENYIQVSEMLSIRIRVAVILYPSYHFFFFLQSQFSHSVVTQEISTNCMILKFMIDSEVTIFGESQHLLWK